MASRGKLAGKARCSPSIQITEEIPGPSCNSENKNRTSDPKLPLLTAMIASGDDTQVQIPCESRRDYRCSFVYQPTVDNCPAAVPSFRTGILQDDIARHPFHHYRQTIAAKMAWVDTTENQWRSTMISLALQSTPLLLSLLAFAAEHLSSVTLPSCASLKKDPTGRAHKYRDSALTL